LIPGETLTAYEELRAAKIEKNNLLLFNLGLISEFEMKVSNLRARGVEVVEHDADDDDDEKDGSGSEYEDSDGEDDGDENNSSKKRSGKERRRKKKKKKKQKTDALLKEGSRKVRSNEE